PSRVPAAQRRASHREFQSSRASGSTGVTAQVARDRADGAAEGGGGRMTSRTLVGARQSALLGLRLDELRPLPEPVELTSGLRKDARRGAARAAILVEARGGRVEPGTCGAVERWYDRTPCRRPAGRGTGHEGDGPCS